VVSTGANPPSLNGFAGGITPFSSGSNPEVGRDGTLYVAYEASVCQTVACDAPTDHDATVVATSVDGGRTFINEEIAPNFSFPATPSLARTSGSTATRLPRTIRLPTGCGSRGPTTVTASTTRTANPNGDVFIVSLRRGHGHSGTLRVGTAADEFFPGVASFAGRIAVSYYTRTFDPGGVLLDYAYSVGWGERINRAPVRRITTQSSDPRIQFVAVLEDGTVLQGVFIGDYTDLAMGFDFKIPPNWTDFRGRPGVTAPNQDAYTQSISVLF
jgi:hypothetical protein